MYDCDARGRSVVVKRVRNELRLWPAQSDLPPPLLDEDRREVRCGGALVDLSAGCAYPFHPPRLVVAGREYAELLRDASRLHDLAAFTLACAARPALRRESCVFGDCPCCTSITCWRNWHPGRRLLDVLSEAHFWMLYLTLGRMRLGVLFRNPRWWLPDELLALVAGEKK